MAKLVNAAQIKDDANLLLEIKHENIIARETLYHESCYKKYTSLSSCNSSDSEEMYLANEPEPMICRRCPKIMSISFPVKE